MDHLKFLVVPNKIPLGRAVDATIIISCISDEALDDTRGRLVCASGLKVVGDDSLYIRRIKPNEKVHIPVRIKGSVIGITKFTISIEHASTDGGAKLLFDPYTQEIEVVDPIFVPSDISFMLVPMGLILQNVISRLVCKVYNNGSLPLEITSIDVSASESDIYNDSDRILNRIIQPSAGLSFDIQILPKYSGNSSVLLKSHFKILEKSFSSNIKLGVTVAPSRTPISQELPRIVRTILIITSAPKCMQSLRTDKELKKILFVMKQSAKLRDEFQVEILPAATAEELSRELIVWHPYIVHFAGHGSHDGIFVEDEDERSVLFPTHALANLMKPLSDQVECVILNACHSLIPAQEIVKNIHFVVGMKQAVFDEAAIVFTRGFYEAIGAGYSIEKAFELGKAVLSRNHLNESDIPVLLVRD